MVCDRVKISKHLVLNILKVVLLVGLIARAGHVGDELVREMIRNLVLVFDPSNKIFYGFWGCELLVPLWVFCKQLNVSLEFHEYLLLSVGLGHLAVSFTDHGFHRAGELRLWQFELLRYFIYGRLPQGPAVCRCCRIILVYTDVVPHFIRTKAYINLIANFDSLRHKAIRYDTFPIR